MRALAELTNCFLCSSLFVRNLRVLMVQLLSAILTACAELAATVHNQKRKVQAAGYFHILSLKAPLEVSGVPTMRPDHATA